MFQVEAASKNKDSKEIDAAQEKNRVENKNIERKEGKSKEDKRGSPRKEAKSKEKEKSKEKKRDKERRSKDKRKREHRDKDSERRSKDDRKERPSKKKDKDKVVILNDALIKLKLRSQLPVNFLLQTAKVLIQASVIHNCILSNTVHFDFIPLKKSQYLFQKQFPFLFIPTN